MSIIYWSISHDIWLHCIPIIFAHQACVVSSVKSSKSIPLFLLRQSLALRRLSHRVQVTWSHLTSPHHMSALSSNSLGCCLIAQQANARLPESSFNPCHSFLLPRHRTTQHCVQSAKLCTACSPSSLAFQYRHTEAQLHSHTACKQRLQPRTLPSPAHATIMSSPSVISEPPLTAAMNSPLSKPRVVEVK